MIALGLRIAGRVTFHQRFLTMAGADDRHAYWPDQLRERLQEKTR